MAVFELNVCGEIELRGSSGEGGARSNSLRTTKSKSASESPNIRAALSGKFLRRSDSA